MPPEVDREGAFQRLVDWVVAAGGRAGPLTLATHDGLRGVVLAADVARDEEILFVPTACWLREEPRATPAPAALAGVAPRSLLAWQLCDRQRRRSDAWKPFLDTLPASFADHPLACAPAALATLPLAARGTLQLAREAIRRDYDALCAALPATPRPGYARFAWAFCCATSRGFGDDPAHPALIPLADLLNHSFRPTCRIRLDADGVHFHALRDLAAGTPATWKYVDAPNIVLLCAYGFCADDHPRDRAPVHGPAITRELCERLVAEGADVLRCWTADVPAAFDDESSRRMLTAIRSTLRAPFRGADGAGQVEPDADAHARSPASRAEELAAMGELGLLCAQWTAELNDRAAPAADADAPARVIAAAGDRLASALLRIVGHFAAMAQAAAAALRCDDREEALGHLAALPDAAYAEELRAHADVLWPATSTGAR